MSSEQLLPLLLGPSGLLVGLVFALYKFQRGDWVARERLDEMRSQRDKALELLEKALVDYEGVTDAITERNRLERTRLDHLRDSSSVSQDLEAAQEQIGRRRTK